MMNRLVVGVGAVLALSLAAGQARAQDGAKADPPTPTTPVLVFEHAGLSSFLVDPKDQALRRALAMVPQRIDELPVEIDDLPPEMPGLVNMAISTLSRPTRFAATYTAGAPIGGFYNYGFLLSFDMGSKAEADKLHAHMTGLLKQADVPVKFKPSTRFTEMLEGSAGGMGLVAYGPRKAGEGENAWRYDTMFGTIGEPDEAFRTLMASTNGVKPIMRGRLDLSGLSPAVKMARGFAKNEPETLEIIDKVKDYGLYGPNGVKANFSVGHTDTHSVGRLVIENAEQYRDKWYLSNATLGEHDFRAIPADAATAMMLKGEFGWLNDLIDFAAGAEPDIREGFDHFTAETGVDIQKDLIASLGGTMSVYTSVSTGGSGLMSGVLLMTFKDAAGRERFVSAHDKLVKLGHSMIDDHFPLGPGYIRITPWKDGDTQMFSLRFPGLPVPFELTYAPLKDWLVVALTPQAAAVAVRQVQGQGDKGLASNEMFAKEMPSLKGLSAVTFTDTRQAVREGYGMVSLLGSAVSNMVRSPRDPSRDPGIVVPVYNELAANVKPELSWIKWEGKDYVWESKSDRSVLVMMAARMGSMSGMVGSLLPSMAEKMGDDWSALPPQVKDRAVATLQTVFGPVMVTPDGLVKQYVEEVVGR